MREVSGMMTRSTEGFGRSESNEMKIRLQDAIIEFEEELPIPEQNP